MYAEIGKLRHTLEAKLRFQKTVQSLAVLASVAVIDALVGTHDRSATSKDSILEWPKIQFMHGLIIDVRRDSFRVLSLSVLAGVPVRLLLVSNVMLLPLADIHQADRVRRNHLC